MVEQWWNKWANQEPKTTPFGIRAEAFPDRLIQNSRSDPSNGRKAASGNRCEATGRAPGFRLHQEPALLVRARTLFYGSIAGRDQSTPRPRAFPQARKTNSARSRTVSWQAWSRLKPITLRTFNSGNPNYLKRRSRRSGQIAPDKSRSFPMEGRSIGTSCASAPRA